MVDHSEKAKKQGETGKELGVGTGLCATCVHVRRVESAKGSVFVLCSLSGTDPHYPKYPRLPVLSCRGYTVRE